MSAIVSIAKPLARSKRLNITIRLINKEMLRHKTNIWFLPKTTTTRTITKPSSKTRYLLLKPCLFMRIYFSSFLSHVFSNKRSKEKCEIVVIDKMQERILFISYLFLIFSLSSFSLHKNCILKRPIVYTEWMTSTLMHMH